MAAHPYEVVLLEGVPGLPGDRQANLDRAVGELRRKVKEDASAFANPGKLAKLAAARKKSNADAKYCWK